MREQQWLEIFKRSGMSSDHAKFFARFKVLCEQFKETHSDIDGNEIFKRNKKDFISFCLDSKKLTKEEISLLNKLLNQIE